MENSQFQASKLSTTKLPFLLTRAIIIRVLYVKKQFLKAKNFYLRGFFLKIMAVCTVSIQEGFIINSGLWWRVDIVWLPHFTIMHFFKTFTVQHGMAEEARFLSFWWCILTTLKIFFSVIEDNWSFHTYLHLWKLSF